MKTTHCILAGAALFLAGVFTVHAQSDGSASASSAEMTPVSASGADYAVAREGDWEFTLGGAGSADHDLDNSAGGVNASLGYYLSDAIELVVRQSGSYSDGAGGGTDFDGSTFVAVDHHFGSDRLRPFVGVNLGRLYGDTTNNTSAAGIEGGLKFYAQAKTFIFALANYAWTFEHSSDAADRFDDGAFLWSVGIGFNF